jgi:hypothetical protein
VKLGTEDRKKVIVLGALGVVAAYLLYANVLSGPGTPEEPSRAAVPAVPAQASGASSASEQARAQTQPASFRPARSGSRSDEFHPVFHSKRPEDQIDPLTVDPTLRLDLLAKVQDVETLTAGRNIFQFGAPPAKVELPKGPEPKIVPKPVTPPQEAKAEPPGPPQPPPPPPINLKYYGFSTVRQNGKKTAFFLDGDEILVVAEGDTVKRHYKVVRVGPTSVVMEDVDSKRQQTLPLADEVAAAG